jgi:hypothetical protein
VVLYSEEEEAGLGPRGLVEGLATTLGTSETRIVYIYIYIYIPPRPPGRRRFCFWLFLFLISLSSSDSFFRFFVYDAPCAQPAP